MSSAQRKGYCWGRRMLECRSLCNERRCSCVSTKRVSFGLRHFGPVSTNVLVISDPAKLMKGTPDATTFPRPRPSAQNRAKLTSPAPAACIQVGPLQMNPSELCAMADYYKCRPQLLGSRGQKIHGLLTMWTESTADARRRLPLVSSAWLSTIDGVVGSKVSVGRSRTTTHGPLTLGASELSSIPHISWSEPTCRDL